MDRLSRYSCSVPGSVPDNAGRCAAQTRCQFREPAMITDFAVTEQPGHILTFASHTTVGLLRQWQGLGLAPAQAVPSRHGGRAGGPTSNWHTTRVASNSRKKRLCRRLCGKPLAFRRRQPPFFPSARLEGSAFQPSREVSQGGSPRKGEEGVKILRKTAFPACK